MTILEEQSYWRSDYPIIVQEDEDKEEEEEHRQQEATEATPLLNSINHENGRCYYISGLLLAFVSGLIFTANNCVIQSFSLDFAETLFVRSLTQLVTISLVLYFKQETIWPKIGTNYNRQRALIVFQGLWGGLMIICSFSSVLYLPLGDALTLIFSAPLSTMVMAAVFLGHRLRLYKITFGLLLLVGTVLVVRPPFIFNEDFNQDEGQNFTLPQRSFLVLFYQDLYQSQVEKEKYYYIGVAIALFSAFFQGFLSISINFCQKVNSLVLLWWAGIGGLLVSTGAFTFDDRARIFTDKFSTIPYTDWICFVLIGFSGICAYFCLTKSLQIIDPTVVAFIRALEIVFAYSMQAAIMEEVPKITSLIGASFVMLSVCAIALQSKFEAILPERIKPIF